MPNIEPGNAYSAFHGTPLDRTPGIEGRVSTLLLSLGVSDLEQLVALAKVPGVLPELAQVLAVSHQDIISLTDHLSQLGAPHIQVYGPALPPRRFSTGAMEPTAKSLADAGPMPEIQAAPIGLPSSVNHIGSMPAVRDQGSRGTCVAFGATAMHEYSSRTRRIDFSEQFIYEETKRIDGAVNDCGTWLVYAMQVLRTLGQCPESTWSYNPNLPCNSNGIEPPSARAVAAQLKVSGHMLNPKDVNAIKSALVTDSNVAFCIPVYNSWYQSSETARSGRITMRVGTEPVDGGHCMCLVGYQDDPKSPGGGYFLVRNSWGSTFWGYQCPYGAGYGTIPYQYLAVDGWEAASIP
jgi:C1A family cysteine protease